MKVAFSTTPSEKKEKKGFPIFFVYLILFLIVVGPIAFFIFQTPSQEEIQSKITEGLTQAEINEMKKALPLVKNIEVLKELKVEGMTVVPYSPEEIDISRVQIGKSNPFLPTE